MIQQQAAPGLGARERRVHLQRRQAPFDDAGLAVLDDLVQGLKVLVPQGEDHPARVGVLPPQPHGLLTAGLHLSSKLDITQGITMENAVQNGMWPRGERRLCHSSEVLQVQAVQQRAHPTPGYRLQ